MSEQKIPRRFLGCPHCQQVRWMVGTEKRGHYACKVCENSYPLKSLLMANSDERKIRRRTKAKQMGTYVSPETKKARREENNRVIDKRYVWWIHGWRCIVPACLTPWPVHAHHVDRKSQGGSDRSVIPLCPHHHLNELHFQWGPRICQEKWGVTFVDIVDALNHCYIQDKPGPNHARLDPFNDKQIYTAN